MRRVPLHPRILGSAILAVALCAASARAQVDVRPLAAPDAFSTPAHGTLGADLWAGSSLEIARDTIPTLAARPLSGAAARLARNLLSTGGRGPGPSGADAALGAARATALLDLGDAEGALLLATGGGDLARDPAMARVAAEAALDLGRPDQACATLAALSLGTDQPYWLRLRAFCLLRAGKGAEAQLAADLAAQAPSRDAAFARLIGVAIAGAGDPGPASAVNGVDLALSRRLKLDLAPAVGSAPAPILAAIASSPGESAEARSAAGRIALRLGLIDAAPVRDAYLALAASPEPPPTAEPSVGGPRGRASARRVPARIAAPSVLDDARSLAAALSATDPAAKEAALAAFLTAGGADLAVQSRLAAPAIAGLAPGPLSPEHKALFAAALTLAAPGTPGPEAAALRSAIVVDAPGAPDRTSLALLDALMAASADTPVTQTAADALAERLALGERPGRARAAAALLVLTALSAAKPPLGPAGRAALLGADLPAPAAAPALLAVLQIASEAGLKGETVLLALRVAQAGGGAGPGPADAAAIVGALRRVGLPTEARAVAREALGALFTGAATR